MGGQVSDEAFAKHLIHIRLVSSIQVDGARQDQAELARQGVAASLADVLIRQGLITPAIRDNVEREVQAQQAGGIQRLGQYKLLKKLGEGGMGAVYLAEDTAMDRKVALKVLPKAHASDADFLTRFRREATAAGRLNHVNIVCAYAVGEELGRHFYVMEYCEGESLEQRLEHTGRLPWDKAVEIVMQVARGLKHAHEHGFIHRDIKPANIIVTPQGVAKILDLGLARSVAESAHLTQTAVAVGTPHYMSPEQARGEKELDLRTDIYSLGATFYHLVTGRTPFAGSSAAVVMMKHLSEQLPNPQDLAEDLPDGVTHVIQKMMAKDPLDRYGDCKELLDDLELVIDGQAPSSAALDSGKSTVAVRVRAPAPGRGAGRSPSPHGGAGREAGQRLRGDGDVQTAEAAWAPKKGWVFVAVGAVAVALVAVGLAFLLRGGGPQREEDPARVAAAREEEIQRRAAELAAARVADQERKAEEARLKEAAAQLGTERQGLEAEKRKAEEERKAFEAARLAAELERKKAGETAQAAPKTVSPKATGGTATDIPASKDQPKAAPATPKIDTPLSPAEARAAKAQELFSAVLKETAPLLAQNRFSEATALLDQKLRDPALADAAESIRKEKADLETVVDLRRSAIEALRKMVGESVTLKMGSKAIAGKVVANQQREGVTLNVGGPEMTLSPGQLTSDDLDRYAPKVADKGEDLRRRGLLWLAAGDMARAKDYFTKARDGGLGEGAAPYLDRVTVLELGEVEAAAQMGWENAEALFARKQMAQAKDAYAAFEREHGQTAVGAKVAATLKERYAAIEAVIGPPKELTLDLGGGVKMELVLIPAGKFLMGSPETEKDSKTEEHPQHEVTISRPFYMGKYEVTQEQWDAVMAMLKPNPSKFKGPKNPVEQVNWEDACGLCEKLSQMTKRAVRLPTEAEWEYACRAGTKTRLYFGDSDVLLGEYAWFPGNAGGTTHPVGQKKPNPWGLYDMHGNVFEWCQDWYSDKYEAGAVADPQGGASGKERSNRGSSWGFGSGFRSAFRGRYDPAKRTTNNGFRVVVAAPKTGSLPEEKAVAAPPKPPVEQPRAAPPPPAAPDVRAYAQRVGLKPEETLNLGNGVQLELVLIPPGKFLMGSPETEAGRDADEGPRHEVTVPRPFNLGRCEVTQEQYEKVVGVNPSHFRGPRNPVETVSWDDTQEFCRKATQLTGRIVRLPTEAEWEYACRAGTTTRFFSGDADNDLGVAGWYDGNSSRTPHPVGQKKPNAWGLYDTHGNVWEWCQDWYADKSEAGGALGPNGARSGTRRVVRGGGWGSSPRYCRNADRGGFAPGFRGNSGGFRVAVDVTPTAPAPSAAVDGNPGPR